MTGHPTAYLRVDADYEPPAAPSGPADGFDPRRRPRRRPWVLLVEDDAPLARAVARGLRRRGFRVTWADSISRARVALASASFDAVLLDVHLPDGTGIDLLEAPTAPGHPRPRFVAWSGEASAAEVRRLRSLGVVAFHEKPAVLDALRADLLGR